MINERFGHNGTTGISNAKNKNIFYQAQHPSVFSEGVQYAPSSGTTDTERNLTAQV
jgi:hypothetical protein